MLKYSLDKFVSFIIFLYDMTYNTYPLSMTWDNIMFVEEHNCSILNSICTGCTLIRYYIFKITFLIMIDLELDIGACIKI